MSLLLSVENVTRRYHLPRRSLFGAGPILTAVNDISFGIERGRTLGIVGESGSGKTTAARMVMGFEKPDSGRVVFQGQDINTLDAGSMRALRRGFQMVFQDPFGSLDQRRTIGWSVAEPLRANPGLVIDHARAVADALDQVGLRPEHANRYPHEFSGGQRQRIAIARAIITRPALIVADEAVSSLDVSVQAQILNLLMDLQEELGLAMLFISHDLAVVSSVCDEVLVMRDGNAIEYGGTDALLANPGHEYTRILLAAAQFQGQTT
jgi:ABC-type oligopeptide transport system ATPase subunit